MEAMLDTSGFVNINDEERSTPLHFIMSSSMEVIVKLLQFNITPIA
jgi:hypothetical protein